MNQVSIVFDLARAAEKMCEWKNVGSSKQAWSEGPFIEAPANQRIIDLPEVDGSKVEPYIAKAAIIEQFEIFKEICVFFQAPFNKKRAEKLRGCVDDVLLDRLIAAVTRRNELTHQDDCQPPTMREAVEYFYDITELAVQFGSLASEGLFDNKSIQPTAKASAD